MITENHLSDFVILRPKEMTLLTKNYIFRCQLAGEPVEILTDILHHKEILQMLVETGIWKKDPLGTQKFWHEYSFKIIYPTRLIDDDGEAKYLSLGDYHLVCL